jgi:hypothetical protein
MIINRKIYIISHMLLLGNIILSPLHIPSQANFKILETIKNKHFVPLFNSLKT